MVSVAVQTDVSPVECDEFVVEKTEIPEDKQGGPELSSASTEHFPANQLTPGATPFDWNWPRLESTSMTKKLQIQTWKWLSS